MIAGDFDSAWRESDRVLAARDRHTRDDPLQPYHLRWVWDGRSFENRSVLVRCYHGLGDTLQFCRFLAPLRRRAHHLTVEIQPELLDLLAQVDGPDEVIAFRPKAPTTPSECDIEIMELSHALRVHPTRDPYLPMLDRRSGRGGCRVGLCWGAGAKWLPERSIRPELLAPLLAVEGVEFVSLQFEGGLVPAVPNDCPIRIVDTAFRITSLDLVISVDTMIAHLAGAMGAPLWLLLKDEPDWRWLAGGNGSVWYDDVRKYRQPKPGDWETPIREAAHDLMAAVRVGTFKTQTGSCKR